MMTLIRPGTYAMRAALVAVFACSLLAVSAPASGVTLRVGPGKSYTTVRAAAEAAWTGDVVLIDAGVYSGDVATWKGDNITVRGVGGRAHMKAAGAQEGGKGTWVIKGRNFTAEGIEFSGAAVPDKNGAGIRAESEGTLVLRDCFFHENENGILGFADSMVVENCVFDRNGASDGRTHNLYVWGRSFTLRNSITRRAQIGHNVKSRAKNNYILYNRITDEADGTTSYEIDVPDCGRTYVIGNVVEQGPKSENGTILSYGAESASNVQDLYVVNNTFVNNRAGGGTFLQLRDGTRARVVNNIFYGPGTTWAGGLVSESHNYVDAAGANDPQFAGPAAYDFRLTPTSPRAIVDAGTPPGRSISGFDLTPKSEYADEARGRARTDAGSIDIGAFELAVPSK